MKRCLNIFLCILCCIIFLSGCSLGRSQQENIQNKVEVTSNNSNDNNSNENNENEHTNTDEDIQEDDTAPKINSTNQKEQDKTADESGNEESSVFLLSDIPQYSNSPYVEINNDIPFFTDDEKANTKAFEKYSDLDELGRCGLAYANLCKELMPTEDRGDIGDIRPTGWHTVKYPEVIEDNYLYNRSHLIAYSLAGENANEKNLITGTRYLNQETMQIFELQVLDYLRSCDNHVLYRVTPVFEGDNLLASGVQMEAWSVEDNGKGICFNVYCYNVQPGIEIDYATGDSSIATETNLEEVQSGTVSNPNSDNENSALVTGSVSDDNKQNASTEDKSNKSIPDDYDYVVNTSSKKIHKPKCSSVSDMAEHNKWYYSGTIEELKEKGYEPCKRCLKGY